MQRSYNERKCSKCKGTGEHWAGICYPCEGTGVVRRETSASRDAREAERLQYVALRARMAAVRAVARQHLAEQGVSRREMRETLRSITLLGEAGDAAR